MNFISYLLIRLRKLLDESNNKKILLLETGTLITVLITSIFFNYQILYRQYPIGIDGGYYFLQILTLLRSGFLYYDTPILPFLSMTLFSIISSDITTGIVLASSVHLSLFILSFFWVTRLIGGRKVSWGSIPPIQFFFLDHL